MHRGFVLAWEPGFWRILASNPWQRLKPSFGPAPNVVSGSDFGPICLVSLRPSQPVPRDLSSRPIRGGAKNRVERQHVGQLATFVPGHVGVRKGPGVMSGALSPQFQDSCRILVVAGCRGRATQGLRTLAADGQDQKRGGNQQRNIGPDGQVVCAADVKQVST